MTDSIPHTIIDTISQPQQKFYTILDFNLTYKDITYSLGLNVDHTHNLRYSTIETIFNFLAFGTYIAEVEPQGFMNKSEGSTSESQHTHKSLEYTTNNLFVHSITPLAKWFSKQSESVKLLSISFSEGSIRYMKNPSHALQLAAVQQNGSVIRYIYSPSPEVQLAAINNSPPLDHDIIRFIAHPTEEAQLASVRQSGMSIMYIKNPSEAVQIAAVQEQYRALQHIEDPSEAVQLAAVNKSCHAVLYLQEPTEAVQLAAVNENGLAIRYIKNPSEAVQLAAVDNERTAIIHIRDPTEAVIALSKRPVNPFKLLYRWWLSLNAPKTR